VIVLGGANDISKNEALGLKHIRQSVNSRQIWTLWL